MKKIILGGVALASLAIGLTSCSDDVVVSTPQVQETAYATYQWQAISDVTTYYLSLDGTETNIGKLSVASLTNTVTYEVPTTDLSVGVHKVKFCAEVKDDRSAWSKEFALIVKETDVTLSMYGDNSFDITTTADVVDLEFKHTDGSSVTARWFNDGKSVNIDDLFYNFNEEDNTYSDSSVLKSGNYTVVAKVTVGENVVESNPVVVTIADYVDSVTVSLDGADDDLVVNFSEELADPVYCIYYDDELVQSYSYPGLTDSVNVSIDNNKLSEIANETGKLPTVRVQVLEAGNLKNLPADVTANMGDLFPAYALQLEQAASMTAEDLANSITAVLSSNSLIIQNYSPATVESVSVTVNGAQQIVSQLNDNSYTSTLYYQAGTNNVECVVNVILLGKTYSIPVYSNVYTQNSSLKLNVSGENLSWSGVNAASYYVVDIYNNGALQSSTKVIDSRTLAVYDLVKDLENPTVKVTAYNQDNTVYAVSNEVELRTMDCNAALSTNNALSYGELAVTGISGSSSNYSVTAYNHATGKAISNLTIRENSSSGYTGYYIDVTSLGYGNYDIEFTRNGGNSFLSGKKVFNVEYLPITNYKVANDKIVLEDDTDLYVTYGNYDVLVVNSSYYNKDTKEFAILDYLDEYNANSCTLYRTPSFEGNKITLYNYRTVNPNRQNIPTFDKLENSDANVYINGGSIPAHVYEVEILNAEGEVLSTQEIDDYSKLDNYNYYYAIDLACLNEAEDGVYKIRAREKGWDTTFASEWVSATYVKTSDKITINVSYEYNGTDIDTKIWVTSNQTLDNLLPNYAYYELYYAKATNGITLDTFKEIHTLNYQPTDINLWYEIELVLPDNYFTNMPTYIDGRFTKNEVDGDIYYSVGNLNMDDVLLPYVANTKTVGCLVNDQFVTTANDSVITVTLSGNADNQQFNPNYFKTTQGTYVTVDYVLVPKGVNVREYLEKHLEFFATDDWAFGPEADTTAEGDLTVSIVAATA